MSCRRLGRTRRATSLRRGPSILFHYVTLAPPAVARHPSFAPERSLVFPSAHGDDFQKEIVLNGVGCKPRVPPKSGNVSEGRKKSPQPQSPEGTETAREKKEQRRGWPVPSSLCYLLFYLCDLCDSVVRTLLPLAAPCGSRAHFSFSSRGRRTPSPSNARGESAPPCALFVTPKRRTHLFVLLLSRSAPARRVDGLF